MRFFFESTVRQQRVPVMPPYQLLIMTYNIFNTFYIYQCIYILLPITRSRCLFWEIVPTTTVLLIYLLWSKPFLKGVGGKHGVTLELHDEAALTKGTLSAPFSRLRHRWLADSWGRGCRDGKDVRARLKTCSSQINSLAPDPSCFNVGTVDDVVLKQGSHKGKERTPRQEPDYSLLSG